MCCLFDRVHWEYDAGEGDFPAVDMWATCKRIGFAGQYMWGKAIRFFVHGSCLGISASLDIDPCWRRAVEIRLEWL